MKLMWLNKPLFVSEQILVDHDQLLADCPIRTLFGENIEWLEKSFMIVEVIQALKDMHHTRPLGPDGFMLYFIRNIREL